MSVSNVHWPSMSLKWYEPLHAYCIVHMPRQANNYQNHLCIMVPMIVYHLNCFLENLQPCTTQAVCLSGTQPLAPPRCSSEKRGVQSTDLSVDARTPGRAQAASRLLRVHTAPRPSRTAAASSFLAFVDQKALRQEQSCGWLVGNLEG